MSMLASEMVEKICPFIKRTCIGPECVNWMGKNVVVEAHSNVWTDGVNISQGRAKCRLWNDEQEYMI